MIRLDRRRLITGLGAGLLVPAMARAADLVALPRQTEGPYYPDKFPTDTDNDLVRVADSVRRAGGEIFDFSGVVRDVTGRPLEGARVEIWQSDAGGRYIHSGDRWGEAEKDAHFQGYGQMLVKDGAAYSFRTIRPVAYPSRTPHIHVKVHKPSGQVLTSQLYVEGEEQNQRDWIYRRLSDGEKRAATMDLQPVEGGAWRAVIDLVV